MTPRPRFDPRLWWADVATPDRALLAAKAAAAAAIAWYLAPFVPFANSEYSYYAPLGVLVSMYPTVARSASSGVQALVGLALGIGLGLGAAGLVAAGSPRIVAVAAVILAGVLVAGIRALGTGRDWVAIAALFVLLLGGADPDGYSSSYLITMAFGVVVGVAVNLLVAPPLHLRRADDRLARLRDDLGTALQQIADALAGRTYDPASTDAATGGLAAAVADVRDEVDLADESRRYNLRGRRAHEPTDLHRRRLDALASTADAARQLAAALSGLTDGPDADARLPDDARRALAGAVHAVSRVVTARTDADATAPRLATARSALTDYTSRLPAVDAASDALDGWEAAVSIRRMIVASAPFAETDATG